jgi:hypothetical protein
VCCTICVITQKRYSGLFYNQSTTTWTFVCRIGQQRVKVHRSTFFFFFWWIYFYY